MKKKGFTLIELLAVIVVLAIIALIATPIVMNTIKSAKKGAAERSADSYIGAVETAIATAKLDGKDIPDGTYQIDGEGNLTGTGLPNGKLTIDMKGNKPKSGTITIKNGQVTNDSKMTVGDYEVAYNEDNKKYEATEKRNTSTEVLCKANTTKATGLIWSMSGDPGQESSYTSEEVGLLASEATSKYDVGVTYTCELGDGEENTFYVLETSGDNVLLIAGMNLGSTVAWSEDGSNHKDEDESTQAVTAKAALKERTTGWIKLNQSQITLPTYDQIYKATGNKESDIPKWLYSYTTAPVAAGYWTSTFNSFNAIYAWTVFSAGNLTGSYTVNNSTYFGVRPVITVSKSQLS